VYSDEGVDIDLENPEDIKKVESEFLALYNQDPKFRVNFGDEGLELEPL